MLDLFFHALTATVSDLATGFIFAFLLVVIALLIRAEVRLERQAEEAPDELEDPWAGLPPKWEPPQASTHPEQSDRRAA